MLLPYLVAFGVLLHILFWGAGLAAIAMPRPWKAFWPVLAGPAGLALQSLVVWAGAHSHLAGTDAYAWPCEALPLVLLFLGLGRRPRFGLREIFRFAAVAVLMAVLLALLVHPLTLAFPGLTTVSLGNCDAADYAAGARVLKEFARTDRSGFLGLTEVVRVMSVGNFFDFWLRLNHFAPSALIAINGTVFDCAPHELISLAAMVFFVISLPVVFWVCRALFAYGTGVSLALTVLFGLSPVLWYAVYQIAIGQLLAAPAIALLTWAGVEGWRRGRGRRGVRLGAVLFIVYGLLLASYNFIIVVCFVPAVAYAGAMAVWKRDWGRFGAWVFRMAWPLVLAGLVYWDRVAGLLERFRLFRTYDFGWPIAGLSPEGWFGVVRGAGLEPIGGVARIVLAAVLVLLLADALRRSFGRKDSRAVLVLACTLPVLAGYGYLLWRGSHFHTHASYDAYKLFSVFHPIVLPALAFWATLAPRLRSVLSPVLILVGAVLLAGAARAACAFQRAEARPPLIVDRDLAGLRRIETMIGVGSVNLRLPDMWSRLWANAFLLRIRQYFPTHTYEGRLNTPLRGDWDLIDELTSIGLPDGASQRLSAQYALVSVKSPYSIRSDLGDGWYAPERLPRTSVLWRWTRDAAAIDLDNLQSRPLRAVIHLDGKSLAHREVALFLGSERIGGVAMDSRRREIAFPEMRLRPGRNVAVFRTGGPALRAPGDTRPLGLQVFGLRIDVLRDR